MASHLIRAKLTAIVFRCKRGESLSRLRLENFTATHHQNRTDLSKASCAIFWKQYNSDEGTGYRQEKNVMPDTGRQSINTSNVLSVIMGGGQGTRLFPLTKERAKPAVPLAGRPRRRRPRGAVGGGGRLCGADLRAEGPDARRSGELALSSPRGEARGRG